MSETLTGLLVQSYVYWLRGNFITSEIKLNQAMAAFKKAQRLAALNSN